jgi:hypothetical protein
LDNILVGTRNGGIYVVPLDEAKGSKEFHNNVTHLMNFHDS